MAGTKKYRARLARLHIRILWLRVQNTKGSIRAHEAWLMAANQELEALAEVKVSLGGTVSFKAFDKPQEMVDLLLSWEATCGIKLALAQAKDATFREKLDLIEAAAGFGEEFQRMVKKAMNLPEGEDLDEEDELKGIPAIEEAPQKFAPVLVEPTKIDAQGVARE